MLTGLLPRVSRGLSCSGVHTALLGVVEADRAFSSLDRDQVA